MFESDAGIVNRLHRFQLTASQGLAWLLSTTVFPARCCLCGFPAACWQLDLCAVCRADLPWTTGSSAGVITAMRFAAPADDMIRELKYHGVIAHARVLGV